MFKNFMKKYGYYLLAFTLILVVGVSAGLNNDKTNDKEVIEQTQTSSIQMESPLKSAQVLKWYSDTQLFYNSTLKQWESHKGVDLTSTTDNGVYSVLDGIVKELTYTYEDGYCIVIEHDNGLVTQYCSLSNTNSVKQGDTIVKGQKIGEISNTASNESLEGNHLHFSVELNGTKVDPSNYITFENK